MFCSNQLVNQIKLKPKCLVTLASKASICHKSELPKKETYHWPYETRSWGFLNFLMDPFTKSKFNENSKIILVEGNVASGKDDFARRLADELGMKYMPEIDLEAYYINDHGYDYRALNPLLPERLRLCDWEMFHENPSRHSVINMQYVIFKLRILQYIKVQQHIFNTGQGVVLNRSVFTERVFVEAMHKLGWLPMGYLRGDGIRFYDWKNYYNSTRNYVLAKFLRPHLTIYLDTPVDICMERIKNSSDPKIRNSKALVPEFLEQIELAYRNTVLPKLDRNGHMLMREYSQRATDDEIIDVIDDIKALDFEPDPKDTRFETWDSRGEALWWFTKRRHCTTLNCLKYFDGSVMPQFDIAGLGDSITQPDLILRTCLFEGQVAELGHFIDYDADTKVKSVARSLTDYLHFGKRIDKAVRNDYV